MSSSESHVQGIERGSVQPGARHQGFLGYRRAAWGKVAIVLALLCVVSYIMIDVEPRHNGGSWYGYTLGTIAVILILWLTLLGVRKRAMTPGKWSLKAWTSAHVYLGLAVLVIGTLHTGFQLGWNVHTLAWVLMLVVILSGMYGIAAYTILPRRLSDNRDEATEAEMISALADIDEQLFNAAQPLDTDMADKVQKAIDETATGRKRGATRRTLDAFRRLSISGDHPNDAAYDSVEALLARKQAAIARIRKHRRTKRLLQGWLYIHVPITFALLAALSAHIVSVFFYW